MQERLQATKVNVMQERPWAQRAAKKTTDVLERVVAKRASDMHERREFGSIGVVHGGRGAKEVAKRTNNVQERLKARKTSVVKG